MFNSGGTARVSHTLQFLLVILLILGSPSTCLFLPLISFQTGAANRAVIVNPSQYPILSTIPGTWTFLIHTVDLAIPGWDLTRISSVLT